MSGRNAGTRNCEAVCTVGMGTVVLSRTLTLFLNLILRLMIDLKLTSDPTVIIVISYRYGICTLVYGVTLLLAYVCSYYSYLLEVVVAFC